jgi:hypothetical protein
MFCIDIIVVTGNCYTLTLNNTTCAIKMRVLLHLCSIIRVVLQLVGWQL